MPWTYGINAVQEALDADPDQVMEVWLVRSRRPGPARERIREAAERGKVRFRIVSDEQLRRAVGEVVHQGVAARVTQFEYADADVLLAEEGSGLIVALDEVQDPRNLGAVIRSARGLGVRAVVIPANRASPVTAAARKVAAGAAETQPVARVKNLGRFLEDAKATGWWVYGAVAAEGVPVDRADLPDRSVIVMGSEDKGIRPGIASKCDGLVTVPTEGVESLNISVAAALLMYEWRRSRGRSEIA